MPRGPDEKHPLVDWTCKQFTYFNRDIGENGELATIYFAKSPQGDILVNWLARNKSTGWFKGIFSEGSDGSLFAMFNCRGNEKDLKNHAHMRCGRILNLWSDVSKMYFSWIFFVASIILSLRLLYAIICRTSKKFGWPSQPPMVNTEAQIICIDGSRWCLCNRFGDRSWNQEAN